MKKLSPGKTHWSTYDLARQTGCSQTSVSKILRKNNIKSHLSGTFMVSNDLAFEEKASKIIGLYLKPPENAVKHITVLISWIILAHIKPKKSKIG